MTDVLRLARGMTFKNAAADLPLGGGKAVILGDPARDKTPELLAAIGRAREELRAEIVAPTVMYDVDADIYAPCAVGAILNETTIPRLSVSVVAGGANNQFATREDGDRLHARGILYAPDHDADGGGIINVAVEILQAEDRAPWVGARLDALAVTMDRILTEAASGTSAPTGSPKRSWPSWSAPDTDIAATCFFVARSPPQGAVNAPGQ